MVRRLLQDPVFDIAFFFSFSLSFLWDSFSLVENAIKERDEHFVKENRKGENVTMFFVLCNQPVSEKPRTWASLSFLCLFVFFLWKT